MPFNQLFAALAGFGLPGILLSLVIVVSVFIARKAGLVANGNQARIANLVLSAILFGLGSDPGAETALYTALGSVLASVIFELLKYTRSRLPFPSKA